MSVLFLSAHSVETFAQIRKHEAASPSLNSGSDREHDRIDRQKSPSPRRAKTNFNSWSWFRKGWMTVVFINDWDARLSLMLGNSLWPLTMIVSSLFEHHGVFEDHLSLASPLMQLAQSPLWQFVWPSLKLTWETASLQWKRWIVSWWAHALGQLLLSWQKVPLHSWFIWCLTRSSPFLAWLSSMQLFQWSFHCLGSLPLKRSCHHKADKFCQSERKEISFGTSWEKTIFFF